MHICPVHLDNPKQPKYLLIMKKITFILFALIAGTAFAQNAVATAPVNAAIVSPITITHTGTTKLEFGNIASPSSATDIVVSNAGIRTAVAGVTVPGTTSSAAAFEINAASGYNYSITIPAIVLTGTGANMGIVFTQDRLSTANSGSGIGQALNVGGTLTVGAGQTAGAYTGTVEVTVAYE